jgi:hypothetical protein
MDFSVQGFKKSSDPLQIFRNTPMNYPAGPEHIPDVNSKILLARNQDKKRSSWKCIMCSSSTIEKKNKGKQEQFKVILQGKTGLECSVCSKKTCCTCLKKMYKEIKQSVAATDTWCCNVESFLHSDMKEETDQDFAGFIGHCCELRIWRKAYKKPSCTKEMKLDGSLHLPEFNLLINSPLGNGGPVDIHGMGQDTNLPPVVHCVLSPSLCTEIFQKKIIPTGKAASFFLLGVTHNFKIDIELPYTAKRKHVSALFDEYR